LEEIRRRDMEILFGKDTSEEKKVVVEEEKVEV